MRVVPLMSPKFQPRPSRTRATVSQVIDSPGAAAPTPPAARRVTAAATAIGIGPRRSTRRPVTSEGRNIAAMCMLMTNPI